jgi:hypothetical protein
LGILLVLFVPQITASLEPARGVLAIEYRRPLQKSRKEYAFADIADVKAVQMSNKNGVPSYSLALILKSGAEILLEGGSTSDLDEIAQVATKIRAQLTPYLQ